MSDPDKSDGEAEATQAIARRIDTLMETPPAGRPTITVVGDDAVSSINLPKRPASSAD